MPSENVADPATGDVTEPHELQDLGDAPAGNAVRLRQAQQVVAGATTTVHVFRVEQRPDLVQREAVVGVALASDVTGRAVGRSKPSTSRIVVVLPAPLGPRNPVTRPGWTVKLNHRPRPSFRIVS